MKLWNSIQKYWTLTTRNTKHQSWKTMNTWKQWWVHLVTIVIEQMKFQWYWKETLFKFWLVVHVHTRVEKKQIIEIFMSRKTWDSIKNFGDKINGTSIYRFETFPHLIKERCATSAWHFLSDKKTLSKINMNFQSNSSREKCAKSKLWNNKISVWLCDSVHLFLVIEYR